MGDDDRWLAVGLAGVLAPATLVVAVLAVAVASGTDLAPAVAWPLGLFVLSLTTMKVVGRVRQLRRATAGWATARRRALSRLLLLVAAAYAGMLGVAALVWWATGNVGWAVVTVAALLVLAVLGLVVGVVVANARAAPR